MLRESKMKTIAIATLLLASSAFVSAQSQVGAYGTFHFITLVEFCSATERLQVNAVEAAGQEEQPASQATLAPSLTTGILSVSLALPTPLHLPPTPPRRRILFPPPTPTLLRPQEIPVLPKVVPTYLTEGW